MQARRVIIGTVAAVAAVAIVVLAVTGDASEERTEVDIAAGRSMDSSGGAGRDAGSAVQAAPFDQVTAKSPRVRPDLPASQRLRLDLEPREGESEKDYASRARVVKRVTDFFEVAELTEPQRQRFLQVMGDMQRNWKQAFEELVEHDEMHAGKDLVMIEAPLEAEFMKEVRGFLSERQFAIMETELAPTGWLIMSLGLTRPVE